MEFGASILYQRKKHLRFASLVVFCGSLILILAPLMALLLLQSMASSAAHRSVSMDELFDAFVSTGLFALIIMGFCLDVGLGLTGMILGYHMRKSPKFNSALGASIATVGVGAVGIFVSLVIIGGVMGILGGILMTVGGAIGAAP